MFAFAHYSLPGDISGVTTWLEHLILHLRVKGYPVAVFLRELQPSTLPNKLVARLQTSGAIVESLPQPRFMGTAVRQITNFILRHKPTVFLPQCLAEHAYAARAAGQIGVPWVFTHHSDDPFYWSLLAATQPFRHNGHLVVVSRHIESHCKEVYPGANPWVIPCGVPIPTAAAQNTSTSFRVLYSGRAVEEQKRISLVVETFIQLCRLNPRIDCRVIGDGAALSIAKKQVEAAGLTERIHFTGRLERPQVERELSEAQALLLMSDYEGLPVALLEAMAFGVVPVCRNIPSGIPEVIHHGETGLLTGDDPRQAATVLSDLASNTALWSHCSRNARDLVRAQYSMEAAHEKWLNLLLGLSSVPSPKLRTTSFLRLNLPRHDPALEFEYLRWHMAPATYCRSTLHKLTGLRQHRNRPTSQPPIT